MDSRNHCYFDMSVKAMDTAVRFEEVRKDYPDSRHVPNTIGTEQWALMGLEIGPGLDDDDWMALFEEEGQSGGHAVTAEVESDKFGIRLTLAPTARGPKHTDSQGEPVFFLSVTLTAAHARVIAAALNAAAAMQDADPESIYRGVERKE